MSGGITIADPKRKIAFVFVTDSSYSGWDVDLVVSQIVPALNLVMENNYDFPLSVERGDVGSFEVSLSDFGRAASVWFLLTKLKVEMDCWLFSDAMMFAGLAMRAQLEGYDVWEYSEDVEKQLREEGYEIIHVF